MKFGEKVKAARQENGLTQKQLVKMTGISLRTIQNYENCERMPKKRDTYSKLASALNIEESVLLDEDAEFVLKAAEVYGSRAARQAEEYVQGISALYAGGELAEEDMDAMMKAIQDAYWVAKEKNRKFVPKKYR